MSRSQKSWGWLGAAATVLIAVAGWTFYAGRAVANAATKDDVKELRVESDQKYAPKGEFNMLVRKVDEVGTDVKELLRRNPRQEYGPKLP